MDEEGYVLVRHDGHYGYGSTPSKAAKNAKMGRSYVSAYLCYADQRFVKGDLDIPGHGGVTWFLTNEAQEASFRYPWLGDFFADNLVVARGEMRLVKGVLECKMRL